MAYKVLLEIIDYLIIGSLQKVRDSTTFDDGGSVFLNRFYFVNAILFCFIVSLAVL